MIRDFDTIDATQASCCERTSNGSTPAKTFRRAHCVPGDFFRLLSLYKDDGWSKNWMQMKEVYVCPARL